MINRTQKGILVNSFGDTFHKLIYQQLSKDSAIYSGNVISLKFKVFGRIIKETTLVRYFIKKTTRPGFTQLGVIR